MASVTMASPGVQAWLQVAASFALYFNHLGLLNSFGVFQAYYETTLPQPPSSISWIGSVQVFLLMALGALIGPLYDLGHCRSLLALGSLLVPAGLALTAQATQFWHLLLSQGVCVGLGACCLSIPSIAIVPAYFPPGRRASAMGIATVGSGLGSTLWPLIFTRLRVRVGFSWTLRVMALVALLLCVFAMLVIRPPNTTPRAASPPPNLRVQQTTGASPHPAIPNGRDPPGKRRFKFKLHRLWDASAIHQPSFILYSIAIFFNNLSFFNPPYYLLSFAASHGMSSHPLTPYLLPILNASSIPGRIIPSLIADRLGSLDTYIVVCALSSSSVFYWISVSNPAGTLAFAVLYGFFSGAVVSLGAVVLASITPDLSRLGTRLGMVSLLKGVGSLIGPPISGALIAASGNYLGVQLFSGSGIMLTSLFSLVLKLVIAKRLFAVMRDDDAAYGSSKEPHVPSANQDQSNSLRAASHVE